MLSVILTSVFTIWKTWTMQTRNVGELLPLQWNLTSARQLNDQINRCIPTHAPYTPAKTSCILWFLEAYSEISHLSKILIVFSWEVIDSWIHVYPLLSLHFPFGFLPHALYIDTPPKSKNSSALNLLGIPAKRGEK